MVNINSEKCVGCGLCVKDCLFNVIKITDGKAKVESDCFKCAHCVAVCPKNAVSIDEYDMSESKEYVKEEFNINADVLLNAIKFRRSVRQFKNKDVENELLEKIIEAGRFTQTSTNAQNVSYLVVKNKINEVRELIFETLNEEGKKILSNLNEETMKFKKYAMMWTSMYDAYKNDSKNDKVFFNAPSIILAISDSAVNASLASSNMELMANALGLGTFFSGFFIYASERNPKIKEILGLDVKQNIVTCSVIGYPNVKYQRTAPRNEAKVTWL